MKYSSSRNLSLTKEMVKLRIPESEGIIVYKSSIASIVLQREIVRHIYNMEL